MENDYYNRLGRLFQFINNNYSQRHYSYGGFNGNYKTYSIDDVQFPADTLKLIDKLKQVRVVDFYKEEYLKSNGYHERYYHEELVKKSEKEYGFHYQLPTILFYYIFDHLKDAATQFLKVIESGELKSVYGYSVKKDEYLFQYPSDMYNEIFNYLNTRIVNFHLLHHQFNFLSDISYNDGRTILYKTKRIKNCITNLDGFDFSKINLSQDSND